MNTTNLLERSFGSADHGVAWAASQLPGGRIEAGRILASVPGNSSFPVAIAPLAGAKGADDFAVEFAGGGAAVRASSATGTMSGLLELGSMLRRGRKGDVARNLRFRTRNYKHEVRFDVTGERSILLYTDATWEGLMRHIVANQFNGLVLYPNSGHPFEAFLDYKEYPYAAVRPDGERAAVCAALNRGLQWAHRYGLTTFMQHYIYHFTTALSRHLGISKEAGERVSGVDRPEIHEYVRWCYRQTFAQCPDLDGLYFNYESAPNAYEHVVNTALYEFNKMDKKPICLYRLWNATEMDKVKMLIDSYKGRSLVSHKISDTADTYHSPKADSRVAEWKQHIPGLEFMYCIGPCHNCGTNHCNTLWADYDFAYSLVGDAHAKGADSISFHSVYEFASPDIDDGKIFDDRERTLTRFNRLHMDAIVDFINGRHKDVAQRGSAMASRVEVSGPAGAQLYKAIDASSKLVLLGFQQFTYTPAWEGFLHVGRNSHIQEPFFYPTPEYFNHQSQRTPIYGWAWIPKTIDAVVVPDGTYQRIIDFVDPAKKKARITPAMIAGLLKKNMQTARKAAAAYEAAGGKLTAQLRQYLGENEMYGTYLRQEILAAISLYSMYFAKTRAAFVKALKDGIKHLSPLPGLIKNGPEAFKRIMRMTCFDRMEPAVEIEMTQRLLREVQASDFPIAALVAYVQSRREYNEIRRHVRPFHAQSPKSLLPAVKQLQRSLASARKALAELAQPKLGQFARNVADWIQFLTSELTRIELPKAVCAAEPGPAMQLQWNQCFRSGQWFQDDFLAFFKRYDLLKHQGIWFQVWRTADELVFKIGQDTVDAAAMLARWEQFKGTGNDAFIMRIHLNATGQDRDSAMFIVFPAGGPVTSAGKTVIPASEFSHGATSWQTIVKLPFATIGAKPKKGDTWRINILANPAISANLATIWSNEYDPGAPFAGRFGTVKFET
jgi:hypothetical protein